MPCVRRPHHQSKFYTACSRTRAGWSSTVFAHELPPRSAGFDAENRLHLFALTMPARVLRDNPPVLANDDAVGVGVDVDRAPDGAGVDRISVVVEAHEAGLRHRGRQRVESVEASAIGNELRPLLLKDVPDRPPALFGMGVRFRPD